MLAGCTLSFVLINACKEDFTRYIGGIFDNMLKKELIEEMDLNLNEYLIVDLKTFKNQITNEFSDNLNRICLSLQTGYKYKWGLYKGLEWPTKTLVVIYKKFLKYVYNLCGGILIMQSKNLELIGGLCYNHSYFIDYNELEEVLYKPKDKYFWVRYPEYMELQSRDVFRMFPKELITLPSKDYVYQDKDKNF
jgi:hypothetical protein